MSDKVRLNFQGNGWDLFKIYLVNTLLTAVTLGIYHFWAQVKVTRFFHQNTLLMDENFDYHATGKERLIGFIKGVLLVAIAMGLFRFIGYLVGIITSPVAGVFVTQLLIVFGFAAVYPILLVGSRRFRLARTSWRNIRFKFSGVPDKALYKELIKGMLLSVVTLGIYYPWFEVRLETYLRKHSQYGNTAFDFQAEGKELFRIYLKGVIFSILTLGIYSHWFLANLHRFYMTHSSFQGKHFSSDIRGGQVFIASILGGILTAFTFGLGFPWAVIMISRVYIESVEVDSAIDFESIQADMDKQASALADGISEAGDALGSIADIAF